MWLDILREPKIGPTGFTPFTGFALLCERAHTFILYYKWSYCIQT